MNHPFPRVANVECLRQLLIQLPAKKPACVSGSWTQVLPLLRNKLPLRIDRLLIFDFTLVDDILQVFKTAPESTLGRHTLLVGFVRLPFATVK